MEKTEKTEKVAGNEYLNIDTYINCKAKTIILPLQEAGTIAYEKNTFVQSFFWIAGKCLENSEAKVSKTSHTYVGYIMDT